jgi:HDOD domain
MSNPCGANFDPKNVTSGCSFSDDAYRRGFCGADGTLELQALAGSEEGINDVIKLVERDPALIAAVLRVANLAHYSQHKHVTNLEQACVRLGHKVILAVAVELALHRALKVEREPTRRCWTVCGTTPGPRRGTPAG